MIFVGVDVSKDTFHAAFHQGSGKHLIREFSNETNGFVEFEQWVASLGDAPIAVAMESTGRYQEPLADFCFERCWQTFVLNPRQTALFARIFSQNKTDRSDASSIEAMLRTQFAEGRFRTYVPSSEQERELRALGKRCSQLDEMIRRERNRQGSAQRHETHFQASLERVIALLEQEREQVEAQLKEIIQQDKEMRELMKLLLSVPGCGPKLARMCLMELSRLRQMSSAKSLTAWLGLAPRQRQSGTSIHSRPSITPRKDNDFRRVLYMAAVSTQRTSAWASWIGGRKERKQGKSLIVAIMDKLARILFGIIKHNRPFDPKLTFPA